MQYAKITDFVAIKIKYFEIYIYIYSVLLILQYHACKSKKIELSKYKENKMKILLFWICREKKKGNYYNLVVYFVVSSKLKKKFMEKRKTKDENFIFLKIIWIL